DQQAALFGEGCLAAGDAKCTYGTGAFLLVTVGSHARRSTAGLVACIAWRLGDDTTYCLDGQVYTVGAAVSWLERMRLVDRAADLDRLGGAPPDHGGGGFGPAPARLATPSPPPSPPRRSPPPS